MLYEIHTKLLRRLTNHTFDSNALIYHEYNDSIRVAIENVRIQNNAIDTVSNLNADDWRPLLLFRILLFLARILSVPHKTDNKITDSKIQALYLYACKRNTKNQSHSETFYSY